jgi:hypothetical protein
MTSMMSSEADMPDTTISEDRDHVISLVLTEAEWKAFLQAQPQPVAWLHERIAELIATSKTKAPDAAYTKSGISH